MLRPFILIPAIVHTPLFLHRPTKTNFFRKEGKWLQHLLPERWFQRTFGWFSCRPGRWDDFSIGSFRYTNRWMRWWTDRKWDWLLANNLYAKNKKQCPWSVILQKIVYICNVVTSSCATLHTINRWKCFAFILIREIW